MNCCRGVWNSHCKRWHFWEYSMECKQRWFVYQIPRKIDYFISSLVLIVWFLFSWVFVLTQHKHRKECVKFFFERFDFRIFDLDVFFDLTIFRFGTLWNSLEWKQKYCLQQWVHSFSRVFIWRFKTSIMIHERKISFYCSQNATIIQEIHFVLSICTCFHLFTIKCFTKFCRPKSVWKKLFARENGQSLSFSFVVSRLWIACFNFPYLTPFAIDNVLCPNRYIKKHVELMLQSVDLWA